MCFKNSGHPSFKKKLRYMSNLSVTGLNPGLGKLTFKVSAAQLKLNPQKVSYAHAQTHILKPERAQTHAHLI